MVTYKQHISLKDIAFKIKSILTHSVDDKLYKRLVQSGSLKIIIRFNSTTVHSED